MRKNKIILVILGATLSLGLLSGCAFKSLEEKLNVVFMNEGQMVDSGTVTQFENYKSPTLPASYVPSGYKFLGWTGYTEDQLDLNNASNFKTQYIGEGRMVHYMDVKKFAVNKTVILQALIMDINDIPKEYHYAVVAWYDKVNTSGLDEKKMNPFIDNVKTYLTNNGVSQDDINTVLFRPYSGNVGPSTGQILFDGDIDIMFGWGDLGNITSTGQIPEEMVLESELIVVPGVKTPNRYAHRLTDTPASKLVMDYFKTDEAKNYFNPGA